MPCICPMPDYIITHIPEMQVFFSLFREIFYLIAVSGRFSFLYPLPVPDRSKGYRSLIGMTRARASELGGMGASLSAKSP